MDKNYIKEQMLLLLMGEQTEVSEKEIRSIISSDPELQAEYEEILILKETAERRKAPEMSGRQWADFMSGLHGVIDSWDQRGMLVRLAEFLFTPLRVALTASAAVVLVIGIVLLFQSNDVTVKTITANPVVEIPEAGYKSLDQIDESYQVAENLIPSDEEMSIVEEFYADFKQGDESKASESSEEINYEFEELKRYYNSNDKEDAS
jgi:hypothetical protein